MVRGILKTPKKRSQEDVFQSSMERVGFFFRENAFTIILALAIIAAFVTWGIWKTIVPSLETSGWGPIENTDPSKLLTLAKEHKGEAVERMALMRAADLLFDEYQREEAPYGKKSKLEQAETIYRDLLKRLGDDEKTAGIRFSVKCSLEKIEREKADIAAGKFPIIEPPKDEEVAQPKPSESAPPCAGTQPAAAQTGQGAPTTPPESPAPAAPSENR